MLGYSQGLRWCYWWEAIHRSQYGVWRCPANSELKTHLRNTCASLARSCPSVVEVCYWTPFLFSLSSSTQDEYKRFLSSDPEMFGGLLDGVLPPKGSSATWASWFNKPCQAPDDNFSLRNQHCSTIQLEGLTDSLQAASSKFRNTEQVASGWDCFLVLFAKYLLLWDPCGKVDFSDVHLGNLGHRLLHGGI